MRIRFLKNWAGRQLGDEENNPDAVLCRHWHGLGVVEYAERVQQPVEPVERVTPQAEAPARRRRI